MFPQLFFVYFVTFVVNYFIFSDKFFNLPLLSKPVPDEEP